MTFQASDLKSNHFLDLLDDECYTIEPSYTKGGSWIRYFSHSNMLCARVTQVITNYAPIEEYWGGYHTSNICFCIITLIG